MLKKIYRFLTPNHYVPAPAPHNLLVWQLQSHTAPMRALAAQVLSPVVQPTADFDAKKLESIDALVKSYVEKNHLVGAVTLIVKNNQLVHYKGHGYANLASKKTMPADAVFHIMSQTKAITSLGR